MKVGFTIVLLLSALRFPDRHSGDCVQLGRQ